MVSYILLFCSAFLAATFLPFYSEIMLFALLQQGGSELFLLATASLGNTAGAALNWYLGKFLLHYQDRKWFYFNPAQVAKMQYWFKRYGVWSLLFAWLPFGGDVLTFIAGVMKVKLWIFLLLVGTGKSLRYIVLWYLVKNTVLQ